MGSGGTGQWRDGAWGGPSPGRLPDGSPAAAEPPGPGCRCHRSRGRGGPRHGGADPRAGCGASGGLRLLWASMCRASWETGRVCPRPLPDLCWPRRRALATPELGSVTPQLGPPHPQLPGRAWGVSGFVSLRAQLNCRWGSVVQTALGHRLPADPGLSLCWGALEGSADPGKGQNILEAGTMGWGLAEAWPGPRVSPLTREPWRRHVPPSLQEEMEEASRGATQTEWCPALAC